MKTIQEQVGEFHEAFNIPIVDTPAVPSHQRIQLRFRLICEEYHELLAALGVNTYGAPIEEPDLAAIADALADLAYVIEGTNLEFGIDSAAVLAEVHRSNMAKRGGEVRDDGKILKPPGWTAPDIKRVLEEQGWTP